MFYLLTAVLLMVVPQVMLGIWPWELTPLTARVVGGLMALFGAFALTVAIDGRWSSCRVPLQSLVLTLVAVIVVVPIFYWQVESRLKA